MSKKFLIIDSLALLHRAFHALPPLKTRKGELVNAVYGFLLVFFKALKDIKPEFVAAAFDVKAPTFRHKEFKEYQAKRPKAPSEIYDQIPILKEILRAFGILFFEKEGFEADDVIGTLAKLAKRQQVHPPIEVVIVSGDLDTLQLIDGQTKVYTLRKGVKDTVLYDEKRVQEKYGGLKPAQLLDFKGLRGDPSDNIPGVTGIGEKTAIELLGEFKNLENIYQEIEDNSEKSKKIKQGVLKKLKDYKDQAFISKKLVEIRQDVPLDFKLKDCLLDLGKSKEAAEVLKKFEFFTLLKKLNEFFPEGSSRAKQEALYFSAKERQGEDIGTLIDKLFKENVFSEEIAKTEKDLIEVVKEIEDNGVFLDKENLEGLSRLLDLKIKKLEKEIYKQAGGEFNINSPSQLSTVLFEKLEIPFEMLRKTPGGVISTGAGELEKIKGFHPIIKLVLEYREVFKLKSGFVDSLPKLISQKDGRIHPNFNQLGTETGRMSCSNPNLQNIPVKGEIGSEIRKCFIANEGFELVSGDYSQMELRVAAVLSNDKKMIDFFKKAGDIHRFVASQIFNTSEDKVTPDLRNLAKTINFGILYGMGPWGLAERAGISRKEAKDFIEEFFHDFEGVAKYLKETLEKTKEKGFTETLFGRKRFLPEINSIDQRLRAQAERMAVNAPIQGTASDIIKMAMVKIKKEGILDDDCKLILQIHDELLFEVEKSKVVEKAAMIKKAMEEAVDLGIHLLVEISSGKNWGELKDFNKF